MHLTHIITTLADGLNGKLLQRHVAVYYLLQGFDCGIYRTVSAGGGLELLTRNIQPDAGYRTDTYAARHLQVFQFDTMILRAVRTCQYQNIIVVNIFLLIGKFQEIFVNLIQFLLIQRHAQYLQAVLQGSTSATGGQYDRVVIDAHIVRIDNLISLHILQYAVLMNARRVRKGITAYDCLVRLHRHIHQAGYHTAGRVNLLRVDVSFNINILMTSDNHSHLFERSISGTFADTVDSNFHLAGAVQHTCHCIGSSHSQVVVAMRGDDSVMNAVHMLHQIFYLRTILTGKAVTGGIGNIHHRSARFDNGFHHTRQVFVIRASGIFGIEFDILYIAAGILHCRHGTFDNLLAVGIEFISDVRVGSTDTGMNTFMLGKLQSFRRHVNIFLYGTCQGANRRPRHSFGNLNHRVKVTRTRNGESRLNHIHAQRFQLPCHLNFFHCIQLASRNLLAIAERCVENK